MKIKHGRDPRIELLRDARALSVVRRLHRRSRREFPRLVLHFVTRSLGTWLSGKRYTDPDARDMEFLADKLIALAPDKCNFCYALCRALGAKRVVEVGTSFGVSTIYLAAAVRDNAADGGVVIGTEIDPAKVKIARDHLDEAGLGAFADIREGDARITLADVGGLVDFVLIDTWIPVALPALRLLVPLLRKGAIVACDNTVQFHKEYADYLGYVRDPANGFSSLNVPYAGGLEISVRC